MDDYRVPGITVNWQEADKLWKRLRRLKMRNGLRVKKRIVSLVVNRGRRRVLKGKKIIKNLRIDTCPECRSRRNGPLYTEDGTKYLLCKVCNTLWKPSRS